MSLELYFRGSSDQRVREYIVETGPKIRTRIEGEMRRQMIALSRHVAEEHLSGRPGLRNITGTLRRSVLASPRVTQTSSYIEGKVSADPTVPYARIHEYGGTIKIPEVWGKLMVFQAKGTGQTVFTMRHRAFSVDMPARSYLRSSIQEQKDEILAGLQNAVREAVRE